MKSNKPQNVNVHRPEPRWFHEALMRPSDSFEYSAPNKEIYNFLYHPSRALLSTFFALRDCEKGEISRQAFLKAESLYLGSEFTDRELAIAAAFFELGMGFDRALGLDHIEHAKRPQKNAGKKSKPQYEHHKEQITQIIICMIRDGLSYKKVQKEVELLTGIFPSKNTVGAWRDNLQRNLAIF